MNVLEKRIKHLNDSIKSEVELLKRAQGQLEPFGLLDCVTRIGGSYGHEDRYKHFVYLEINGVGRAMDFYNKNNLILFQEMDCETFIIYLCSTEDKELYYHINIKK